MLRAYKYRIYPNDDQKVMFAKTFGCVRYVYNWALETKLKLWEDSKAQISCNAIQESLRELKKDNDWLKEVNAQSLQSSIRDLDSSFVNYIKQRAGFPKFKCKGDKQTFRNPQYCFVDFERRLLHLPKIKDIKIVFHRTFQGVIKNVTIRLDKDGRYYASILVDTHESPLPLKPVSIGTTLGIDTGLETFAVCSNGERIRTPHFQRNNRKKIRRLHQRLDRKIKGSKQREKARIKLARAYSKIARQRLDWQHKITHRLTHESQVGTICVDHLNIAGMNRNKHMSYNSIDAAFGEFYRQLEYKSKWYGVNYVKIPRFTPTSQICNICGHRNKKLKLKDRRWECPSCGSSHNRDLNAAFNVKIFGFKTLLSGRENVKPVECPLVDDKSLDPKKQWHERKEAGMDKFSLSPHESGAVYIQKESFASNSANTLSSSSTSS